MCSASFSWCARLALVTSKQNGFGAVWIPHLNLIQQYRYYCIGVSRRVLVANEYSPSPSQKYPCARESFGIFGPVPRCSSKSRVSGYPGPCSALFGPQFAPDRGFGNATGSTIDPTIVTMIVILHKQTSRCNLLR